MGIQQIKLNPDEEWKVIVISEGETIVIRPQDRGLDEILDSVWDNLINWLEATDLTPIQIKEAVHRMFPEAAEAADDCEIEDSLSNLNFKENNE